MTAILDDYGIVLLSRPHELYFLDLSQYFPAEGLDNLYKRWAKHLRNETHWQIKGYLNVFKS